MPLKCTWLAIALFFAAPSFSQYAGKVTVSDYIKIKVSAESLIATDLKDLMNSVASSDLDKEEIEKIIRNSCSGNYNKIFDSSNVIIEDDINPAATKGKSQDHPVSKYLKNLDLLYTKSDNQSIVLTVAKVSSLKRSGRYYLKVYYTSFFRNKNKTIDTPYTINNRVAEIYVSKDNNRWNTSIARIGFFVPADTVNDVENDVALDMDDQTISVETAMNDHKTYQQQLLEKERKEQIEKAQKINEAYDKLIQQGDKAMAIEDFKQAIKNYNDAKLLKPYDKLVIAKINNALQKSETSKLSREAVFNEYIRSAQNAVKKREYKKAIEAYEAARDIDPTRIAEHAQAINDLKIKYGNVDKLDEMYKIGQYKEAVSEYSSLIKKNKTYSDYYLGRGKCYDKMGETGRAMKDYTEAYNLESSNLEALIQRADLNKRLYKYVDAIADYKSYIRSYKENPDAYLQLADLRLLNNRQLEEAIATMNEGLGVDALKKIPDLYFKRGELLMQKNDWKNGIDDFSAAILYAPTHKLAFYDRGTCYLKLNRVSDAAADFESARSHGLDSIFINVVAGFATERFVKAAAAFNQHATDDAIAQINDAIAIDPQNDKYRFTKGEYYFSLKQYQQAIQCYDEAVERNPKHATAWYRRGLSYHLLENYKTAIESFNKALHINTQYALAEKGIADAQFALKDYESAAVAYETCLGIINSSKLNDNSLTAEVFNGLGKSYYQLQNYEKSLAALKSALRKNELLAEAWFNRGLTYYRSGKLEEAMADLDKALTLDNRSVAWKYYRARAYHDDNKFNIAISHYNDVINADSMHLFSDAVYHRGKSYYADKQYQPALADYLAAYAQHMDTAYASFNYEIGNIYLNSGQYDSAILFFNKAIAKDAGNGYATYGIASSMLLKGNRDEAFVWFEKSFATHMPGEKEIKRDPLIKGIVSDKKFKDLLKKYY
jgi:tetratricopeptide (TPR) repeat protein